MNRYTGKAISKADHLRQSIEDILTTPLGTRIFRRDYGSRLFDLIDRPQSEFLKMEIFGAIAEALNKWEPRIKITAIEISNFGESGQPTINLSYSQLIDGQEKTMQGISLS